MAVPIEEDVHSSRVKPANSEDNFFDKIRLEGDNLRAFENQRRF